MAFLRLLEGIRFPALNWVMQLITYCGEELVFMVAALVIFWCINKREGYYILSVGFIGTILSQFLKLLCRIPRPWVADPDFTIVESARAGATGYSFPSGHTQNAIGTFGGVARWTRHKGLRWAMIVLAVLVSFSRMYLGVHTPLDVGVGFVIAVVLVLALYPVLRKSEKDPKVMYIFLGVMLFISVGYVLFVNLYPFPADLDPENYAEGVKNSYSLLGALLGLALSYHLDETRFHFDESAPLLGQILKVVLGLILIVGIRAGLKPLLALISDGLYWNAVRYFCMVAFAGIVWPRTFSWFQKIGRKQ